MAMRDLHMAKITLFLGPRARDADGQALRRQGQADPPLAASTQGLIYVNPEGHLADSDPAHAIDDIRQTFGNMGMDDRETVALIAGGHTIGKAHGAHSQKACQGKEPAAGTIEQQGFGWHSTCASGVGKDAITSGLEGAWSQEPTKFTGNYNDNLLKFIG